MRRFGILFSLFSVASVLLAQSVTKINAPYYFSFEQQDSVEIANWVLNAGPQGVGCNDQWMIGSAVKNDGLQSLYITTDFGKSNLFGNRPDLVYAYRDFTIDRGSYEVIFDWHCVGASQTDLWVGLGTVDQTNCQSDSLSGFMKGQDSTWCKVAERHMKGKELWTNQTIAFSSNGSRTYRLFFAFANNNIFTSLGNPIAAAIDNIQIVSTSCRRPDHVDVNVISCDSVLVTWPDVTAKYQVQYRVSGKNRWVTRNNLQTNRYLFENLAEGAYDFRVRGICDNYDDQGNITSSDTSAYTYHNHVYLFCPDQHCVNFIDLEDSTLVTCTHTFIGNGYPDTVGVVNYGIDNPFSRHTVCWEKLATDPNTGDQLRMIPDDEFVSVRLGNPVNGKGTESIAYQYYVDSVYNIMLLKYALVLQDPQHKVDQQPHFRLEILDENGESVDPECGDAAFAADRYREGWHVWQDPRTYNWSVWKDWTTVGLNLSAYVGRTLTIRFTTRDCTQGGHWGYGYFTVGCAAGRIQGVSCGGDASLTAEAPAGFTYEWFNKNDSLVSTDREFSVASSDTTTYRCHLRVPDKWNCGFDLYASLRPQYPVADFTYEHIPSNCENRVRLVNKSHIMTDYEGNVVHHYDQACEEYDWVVEMNGEEFDYQTVNPIHAFPKEGGTFNVHLYAYLSERNCVNDTIISITVPAIHDHQDTIFHEMCYGDTYNFGRRILATEGTYVDTLQNVWGCDSVSVLVLRIHEQDYISEPDTTICYGQKLTIDAYTYRQDTSGVFTRFYKNVYGCDSTVQRNVIVLDPIRATVTPNELTADPNSGRLEIEGSGYTSYEVVNTITGASATYQASQTVVEGLQGGFYEVTFYNDFGCSETVKAVISFECLEATVGEPTFGCKDDWITIPYNVNKGYVSGYSVLFDSVGHNAGLNDLLRQSIEPGQVRIPIAPTTYPDFYNAQLVLHDPLCEDNVFDFSFVMQYRADSVITQRWNDFLSVRKATETLYGEFQSYQWYKNGMPIDGATGSQYYVPETGLDTTATYAILLVRKSDGRSILSCDFEPLGSDRAPRRTSLTLVQNNAARQMNITSSNPASARLLNAIGLPVATFRLQAGSNQVDTDVAPGVYMLEATFDNGERTVRKVVIQ